ncbi:phage shock envelope stress response protein PspM [Natronoglycomyces albus]|uniref:Uncharacterized protein n=1 Tax=Natronoglycomyces albus TaxID=2811108 RepID=A0A895XPU4_9ACTN|nr:hypothetical protein [Natronoglycomyces albus]QSB04300.1 hypothetical protein JQS30_10865 [Natronoglycomyces albus]
MESTERQVATRRLHRSLSAAKSWTVFTGIFTACGAFFIPYSGVTATDGVWVGLVGLSGTMALIRWGDYRRTSKAMPHIRDSLALYGPAGIREEARTWKSELAGTMRVARERKHYRGSLAWKPYQRLVAATETAEGLAKQLDPSESASKVLQSVSDTGPALRELAERIRGLEKTMAVAPAEQKKRLKLSRQTLLNRLESGVSAYEEMVVAAGECLSEQRGLADALETVGEDPTLNRLSDAALQLRAEADAAGQMRGSLEAPSGPGGQ